MTYQISFSGGVGSAVSALIAKEQGLAFNLIFADTLIEDQDLYRFNDDVARVCGQDLVVVTDGRTPWEVYVDHRWIGNTRTAHCSTQLKTVPIREWLEAYAQPSDPLVLGMDYSEQDRVERARVQWAPRPVVSLLNRYKVYRPQYDEVLARHGIRKPRLYAQGYEHNNCGGFCCKAGLKQFDRLYRTNPLRYLYHEGEMEWAMAEIGQTARPFLRKTVDKEMSYLSLREFRQLLETDAVDIPEFSPGSCGCFTDDEFVDELI